MSFQPSPKQALFLWKMICAENPQDREPKKSKATPELKAKTERQPLIDAGFLDTEKRGSAEHLILADKAWAWAARAADVKLSESKYASAALQGLLRHLVPFLQRRDLALADVFAPASAPATEISPPERSPQEERRVPSESAPSAVNTSALLARLASDDPIGRVELLTVRRACGSAERWAAVQRDILELHEKGLLELFREDNNAAITEEVEAAALRVGREPRHILYWRGKR